MILERKINGIKDLATILNANFRKNSFKNKDLREAMKVVRELRMQCDGA